MARFKLSIKYETTSTEEIVEVEAETASSARRMCEKIVADNSLMMERLERLNVWTSKKIESCSLCPYDYKLDLLGCEAILKNNV